MKNESKFVVTAENVGQEPYYNLLQLCRLTGYAYPNQAIQSTGESLAVIKDECGNILRKDGAQ